MNLSLAKKIILTGLVPLCFLLINAGIHMNTLAKETRLMQSMQKNIHMQTQASKLIYRIQRERGCTSLYLNNDCSFAELDKMRKETDALIDNWEKALLESKVEKNASYRESAEVARKLTSLRASYNRQDASLHKEQIEAYSKLIQILVDMQSLAANGATARGFGKIMSSNLILESARERAGILRASMGLILSKKKVDEKELADIIQAKAMIDANLKSPALALSQDVFLTIRNMEASSSWKEFDDLFNEILNQANRGVIKVGARDFWGPVSRKMDDITIIVDKSLEDMNSRLAIAIGEMKQESLRGSLLSFFPLLFTTIFAIFVTRSIIRGLNEVNHSIDEIAKGKGDLTQRLKVKGKDELAKLALSFNGFSEGLQSMVRQIKENIENLDLSTKNLGNITENTVDKAKESSSYSANLAKAAEDVSRFSNIMLEDMEKAYTDISLLNEAIRQIMTAIQEIARSTADANSYTGRANSQAEGFEKIMLELSEAASEIGQVSESINSISEQTNLLALNATIEAARAGEAGRGFAVVANEIKELAGQTALATEDIREKIEAIQKTSENAKTDMDSIIGAIENIDQLVGTIASAAEEQSSVIREVSDNMDSASRSLENANTQSSKMDELTREMVKDIKLVSLASKEIEGASLKVLETVNGQAKIADNLNNQVKDMIV